MSRFEGYRAIIGFGGIIATGNILNGANCIMKCRRLGKITRTQACGLMAKNTACGLGVGALAAGLFPFTIIATATALAAPDYETRRYFRILFNNHDCDHCTF